MTTEHKPGSVSSRLRGDPEDHSFSVRLSEMDRGWLKSARDMYIEQSQRLDEEDPDACLMAARAIDDLLMRCIPDDSAFAPVWTKPVIL